MKYIRFRTKFFTKRMSKELRTAEYLKGQAVEKLTR
jgi:hypothetical protein